MIAFFFLIDSPLLIGLYKKYDFSAQGLRKNYYQNEDGLIFWTPNIQSESYKKYLD